MAIHYHISECRENGKSEYTARSKSVGTVGFNEVRRDITSRTFLHEAELVGAVTALTGELIERLRDGLIVDMGDLGHFQVCFSSEKAEDPIAFRGGKKLRSVRVVFRPGRELRQMLKTLEFKEWK